MRDPTPAHRNPIADFLCFRCPSLTSVVCRSPAADLREPPAAEFRVNTSLSNRQSPATERNEKPERLLGLLVPFWPSTGQSTSSYHPWPSPPVGQPKEAFGHPLFLPQTKRRSSFFGLSSASHREGDGQPPTDSQVIG